MDPETKILHKKSQSMTMPALMLTTMPPLSPFTSALPNHVLEDHHLTLHLLAHALAQERTTHARP